MFRDSGRGKIRPLLFWLSGNSAVIPDRNAVASLETERGSGAGPHSPSLPWTASPPQRMMCHHLLWAPCGHCGPAAEPGPRFKGFGRFSGTTNERPKGSHYCNIGSRACAISQPMISAFWLVEPPRAERPWWPASMSVRSNKSRGSVLLARSRATHLAGSA